jgi:hypothetical protein
MGLCCGHKPPRWHRVAPACLSALFYVIVSHVRGVLIGGFALGFVTIAACLPAATQGFVANGVNYLVGPLPGFDAPGISSGEFLLKSYVSFGVAYDSNILRSPSAIHDYIFFVAPAFDLTRDGGNHIEELFASVVSAKYAKSDADNFTNAYVRARETYFVSPTSQIVVNSSFADGYQRRISDNHDIPANAAAPVHYQTLLDSLAYTKFWENVSAGATLTASHATYDDVKSISGAILDQTFRDENDFALQAFLNAQLSQHINSNLTFFAGHSDVRDQSRNSDQWRLSNTTTVDLTSKTSIGFLAGVKEQDYYNNPLLGPPRPLYQYEALLRWSPVQTLIFTGRGGYHDLDVDFTKGILGGGVGRYGSLDFTYLISRNLQLTSGLRYEKSVLSGNQVELTTVAGRAGLIYEFSSHAGLSFVYTLEKLDATNPAQFAPYDENVFQASLNLRF